MTGAVLLAIVAAILLWVVLAFNGLVRARNQMRAAFADIDVQLTRRHDLVPQLVAAVQAYAGHERATLAAVTELRQQAMQSQPVRDRAPVENALGAAVTQLLAVAEAYPDLKAAENFLKLSRDLVAVEDYLQYARRFYNGAVRELNDRIGRFPDLLIAAPFGFAPADFYALPDAAAAAAPAVALAR